MVKPTTADSRQETHRLTNNENNITPNQTMPTSVRTENNDGNNLVSSNDVQWNTAYNKPNVNTENNIPAGPNITKRRVTDTGIVTTENKTANTIPKQHLITMNTENNATTLTDIAEKKLTILV